MDAPDDRDDRAHRSDFARWFIDHDEVDEAARVLAPGDELELGRSDYLDLAAALGRRGLGASYEGRRVIVREGDRSGARKPPARIPLPPPATSAKKTA